MNNLENNETLEQPEVESSADTTEASKILDRFASVADLEMAYVSLRSEFTQKCQRLGELEQLLIKQNQAAEVKKVAPAVIASTNFNYNFDRVLLPKTINQTTKEVEQFFIRRTL